MRFFAALVLSSTLLSPALSAQQPNAPGARLLINGTDGPPYPILGVPVFGGTQATLEIQGDPNTPVILASDPYPGLPDEGLYEGFAGTLSITGAFSSSYDLLGQKILFRAMNPPPVPG